MSGSAWANDKAFTFDRGGLTERANGIRPGAVRMALVPKAAPFTMKRGLSSEPAIPEVGYPWKQRESTSKKRLKRASLRLKRASQRILQGFISRRGLSLATLLVLAMVVIPGNMAIDDAQRLKRPFAPDSWLLAHQASKGRLPSAALVGMRPADVELSQDKPVPPSGPPDKRSVKYATLRVIDPLVLQNVFGVPDLEVTSPFGIRHFEGQDEMHWAVDIAHAGEGDKRVLVGFKLAEGEGNSRVRVLWVGPARNSGPNCPIFGFRAGGLTYAGFIAHADEVYKGRGEFVDGDALMQIGQQGRCTGPNAHLQLKKVTGEFKLLLDQALDREGLPEGLTPDYVQRAFFNKDSGPFINPLGLFARMHPKGSVNEPSLAAAPQGVEYARRPASKP